MRAFLTFIAFASAAGMAQAFGRGHAAGAGGVVCNNNDYQDMGEMGIDCGGGGCPACGHAAGAGGVVCNNNDYQDMDEMGIDCGGGGCPACAVLGCTDATATNYDSSASSDNGSCVYQPFESRDQLKEAVDAWYPEAATTPYGPIRNWDTSKVQSMYAMFYEASDFNGAVGNWDTGKVTTMYRMFWGASDFNGAVGNWDTGKVTTMDSMFYRATSFNQPLAFDTSKVENMSTMFSEATSFNQPLSSFDTSKVTNMMYMFYFSEATSSSSSFAQEVTFDMSLVTEDNQCSMFEGSKNGRLATR